MLNKVNNQCKDLLNLYLRSQDKIYVQLSLFRYKVLMFHNWKQINLIWFKYSVIFEYIFKKLGSVKWEKLLFHSLLKYLV